MSKMYDIYAKQDGAWLRKGGMNADGTSAKPIEISTEAEMTSLLATAEVGTIYKYTGESGTYENGALYLVESTELTFTISYGDNVKTFIAEKGMTWEDFVISDYNDGRVYIYNSTLCYRASTSDPKDGVTTVYLALDDGTRTGPKPTDLIIADATYGAADY